MDIWQIVLGLALFLIGWSVAYDDREDIRAAERELEEEENSPDLYPHDNYHPNSQLDAIVCFCVGLFYMIRGGLLAMIGIILMINGAV